MERIGLVRCHDFLHPPLAALQSIFPIVDGVCILVDIKRPPEMDMALCDILNMSKVLEAKMVSTKYSPGTRFQEAFDMIEKYNPTIVLFPDEDEVLPCPHVMEEELERWQRDDNAVALLFEFAYTWNDENTIANPYLYHIQSHAKALKYNPDYMNWRSYHSRCMNRTLYHLPDNTRMVAKHPIRGFQFMTETLRAKREAKVAAGIWRGRSKYWEWWRKGVLDNKDVKPFSQAETFAEILEHFNCQKQV